MKARTESGPLWRRLLQEAYKEAIKSPDLSTQNGALIVNIDDDDVIKAAACNELPSGVLVTEARLERPLKYKYTEHAERNVIYKAAKAGVKTDKQTMVYPWAACSDCARAIIQAGIATLITHKQAHNRSPERWVEEIQHAFFMFEEAGVEVIFYDGKVFDDPVTLLHSEVRWSP